MLELHKLQITGDDMKVWNISSADDFLYRSTLFIIPNGTINRFVDAHIEFRLVSEQGRQTGLRIEIDCKNAVASQCEILRKVGRRSGLSRSTFEIHDGEDLKFFPSPAMGQIAAIRSCGFI
ncbi:hypothetical protein L905_07610 [Agrobacterium sp. TS43]|nr:hypothetical protein L905_07610 [Agrobacterium sp. TS43]